jgi:choline/glycine/proline betaine transport protein
MGVFGNSAIDLILNQGASDLAEAVAENQAVALFQFLEYLPFSTLLAGISLLMVVVFFVTSADSGALVLNMLSAHGRDDTPVAQRVFWAFLIGAIAAVLLVSGGLASLQTAAIASALPFSMALLGAIWGFVRALSLDVTQRDMVPTTPAPTGTTDWRERLDSLLSFPDDRNVRRFLRTEVVPTLEEVASEMKRHDIDAQVSQRFDERSRVRLEVLSDGELDFLYEVRSTPHAMPDERLGGTALASMSDDDRYYRAEVHLSQGGRDYCIMGWTRDQITHDILNHYESHLEFLKSVR